MAEGSVGAQNLCVGEKHGRDVGIVGNAPVEIIGPKRLRGGEHLKYWEIIV